MNGSMAAGLFQQDWWLQASGGKDLERVEVKWDGEVVAALCFVRKRFCGMRVIKLPPYTRTHGPMLSLPVSKPAKHTQNLHRAVRCLIENLPKHDRFHLLLDPEDPTAFPFAMAGCLIEQAFTFRLPAHTDLDQYWENLHQKTRNLIRSAAKKLVVHASSDTEILLDMSAREHHPKRNIHNFDAMRRIARESSTRGQSTVLLVKDDDGKVVASTLLVWDDAILYFWQSSRDPHTVVPGANSLLVWEAIKFALNKNLTFDFDGSHSHGAAQFAVKFGIDAVARPSVIHMSTMGMIAQKAALQFGWKPNA